MNIIGRENIASEPVIYASKHQAQVEIVILTAELDKAVFVLKEELARIPIFGRASKTIGHIPVDREKGARALRSMVREAKDRIANGRSIIIFPEGTRKPLGAEPDYKPGVYELYRTLKTPVVPVALNTAVYADPKSWFLKPGTVTVSFLPPIQPGLDRETFTAELIDTIETETNRLVRQELGDKAPSYTGKGTPAVAP